MMKKKLILLIAMALTGLSAVTASAQNSANGKAFTVSGVVKDANGETLPGASVNVKGTEVWAVCDADGKYTIKASKGAVLEFSYVGFVAQDVTVNSANVDVTLEEDVNLLDEVLVVGYGTVFKKKTTSAITTVNAEKIAQIPTANITQTLAGQAPGLIVTQQGGGVDAMADVSIRGGGTPLYVIDGIICRESDFNNINPNDIENISILKDASSTAIYGARAANGIMVVTTKRGQKGKLNVDYTFNYGVSEPANLPGKVDSYTSALSTNQAYIQDGSTPYYDDATLEVIKNGTDPEHYANTDWYDICLRSYTPTIRHNLAVSGGNDKVKFYSGVGYNKEESLYNTESHNNERFNFRTNVDANFEKIGLKVSTLVDAWLKDYQTPSTLYGGSYFYVFSHIQNHGPMSAARNPAGQIYGMTIENPLTDISDEGGYYKSRTTNVRTGLNLEWSLPWVKGLKFSAIGSYEIYNSRDKSWNQTCPTYDWEGNLLTADQPKLYKNTYSTDYFNVQFLADYSRSFKSGHTFSVTAGLEASGNEYDNLSANRKNYVLDVDQLNSGPSSTMENSASEGIGEHRAGVIGRARYDYKSRYMVEVNMRYDGSDYFPEDHRWGLFFSGSLAYAISEENWWKNGAMNKVFDTFKIRASYGEIGLDDVTRYSYVSSYGVSQRGILVNGSWVPTFSEGSLPTTEITWYKTKDFNVGLDFSTLSSRLSGSLDYFSKITTGYLASPSNVGYTSPLGKSLPQVVSNGERIRQGFEIDLHWKDKVGAFTYGVSGNFTLYDDRWNINPNESETTTKNPYQRNTQVSSYSGIYYHSLGYYTSQEDVMNSPHLTSSSNLTAGDIKYEDFNGDGKIDSSDKTRLGYGSAPRSNYGISVDLGYKGLFFNMLWQGAGHYNIYDGYPSKTCYWFQQDNWTADNTNAQYPRLHATLGNGSNNSQSSDFWLIDCAYIRLKNLAIGYDFKSTVLKNARWLSKLSLSLSGTNLFTFSQATKYGYDPEYYQSNGYTYPITRMYSLNLTIGF